MRRIIVWRGSGDNLLSAIKGGKVLRKVDAAALAPAKKVDPKADFLSAIKSGSHKAALRRVEVAEKPKAEEAKSEIADILARRMVIAAESESDGSDSDVGNVAEALNKGLQLDSLD